MERTASAGNLMQQHNWTANQCEVTNDDDDNNHCIDPDPAKDMPVTSASSFPKACQEVIASGRASYKKSNKSSPWERFARTTTGHGFARMVDHNDSLRLKCFWAFVVILLTFGLLISVFIISYEYLVVKGLRREFMVQRNKSLLLPDIHICDTSIFNPTILQEMGLNNSIASYLTLALSPLLASHGLQEDRRMREALAQDYQRFIKNKTMFEVFDKAALKCEDMILGCTYKTVAYPGRQCCDRFFGSRRYLTNLATLCISTHGQLPLEEMFVSQIHGFTVYLKTNSISRFEFDSSIISSNVASRRGFMYAVSDRINAVSPSISTAGHYATPGTWTSVSISLTRTDNTELATGLLSPYTCASSDSSGHLHLVPNHETYSERNCVFSSARSILEAKVNCSRFRFRKMGDLTPCHPDVMIDAYSLDLAAAIKEKTDECPEDCISNDYQVSSSTTLLHLGEHDDMHADQKHDDNVIHSAIHFYYPSFSYTIIKNHPPSLVKWLSEVGGNMSLYLGASLVTLLELVVLLIRVARRYFL